MFERVRSVAGFFAAGGVEGQHAGMEEGALPPDVQAASVLRFALVLGTYSRTGKFRFSQ
jgi:hypothetical protein